MGRVRGREGDSIREQASSRKGDEQESDRFCVDTGHHETGRMIGRLLAGCGASRRSVGVGISPGGPYEGGVVLSTQSAGFLGAALTV